MQALERSAVTNGWPKDKWSVLLGYLHIQLIDRALQVYEKIRQQDAIYYDLKVALLLVFCAIPETYKTRF